MIPAAIRAADPADAVEIARLESELFPGEAWSEAQVGEELTGYGRRGWVLVAPPTGGELTGYVVMRTIGDVSDLQRIGVAPSVQRAGVAGRLLEAALAGVREEGAERVLLEVAEDNVAARGLYARFGFVEIDRRPRYYRQTVDALVLELTLPTAQ